MANILLNVAHQSAGATTLAFSPDGKTMYSGGGDCVARVWSVDSESKDADPEKDALNEADEAVTSITATPSAWITSSADSSVRLYNAASNQLQAVLLEGGGVPIRDVAVDPAFERLAVASDDLDVKVIDVKDPTQVLTLTGHKNGVRKASWHPSSSYLTTSGQDGRILVWDMTSPKPSVLKSIEGLIPFSDPESTSFADDCSAVWHPSGKHFYVASKTHEIAVVSRDTWARSGVFPSSDEISGEITALAVSPNGQYLASASKDGILIWSTAIRRVLFRYQPDAQTHVNHLLFSTAQNLLAWGDTEGNLYRWVDPIAQGHPGPSDGSTASAGGKSGKAKDARERSPGAGDMEEDFGEDVDEDWIIDDIGAAGTTSALAALGDGKGKEKSYAREIVSVTKAQPPFQPGATPLTNRKGYLAYNKLGVIEVTDQDSHQIINVEFHDRSTYNSHHFTDQHGYSLASMGERGIVYAAHAQTSGLSGAAGGGGVEKVKAPACVAYKPYAAWGSSTEWRVTLPAGEDVAAVAAGGIPTKRSYKHGGDGEAAVDPDGAGNVIVATSTGYIRFFAGSGIQRYVWAMGGDVVSMVAGNEWVFVVHRQGGTSLDGCQNLLYSLISLDRFEAVQEGTMPLPKGKTLKWIGVSDEGAPAMYDSHGVLFLLDRFRRPGQARWVPILDTNTLARRVGKDESYWPVGVSGKMFMCVILKGRAEYPGFPRPLVQELDLQIPLLETEETGVVAAEEKLLRETIILGWMRDALGPSLSSEEVVTRQLEMDKDLIKLLQLAIKERHLQRAHDIIKLLHHISSLDTAMKLAEYYHLVGLQDKIRTWKAWREENDDPSEERDERQDWERGVRPIYPPNELVGHLLGGAGTGGRPQEFRPAPMFPRRGLGNAIPSYGQNVFVKKAELASSQFSRGGVTTTQQQQSDYDEQSYGDASVGVGGVEFESLDDNAAVNKPSPPAEGKRKRAAGDVEDEEMYAAAAKKPRTSAPTKSQERVSSTAPPNPFVRKMAAAVPANAKPNPFARTLVPTKSLVKSNTFFEKVDAAEAAGPVKKGKASEKKAVKQTTLFGMPAPEGTKPSKGQKGKKREGSAAPATSSKTRGDEDTVPQTTLDEDDEETQLVETQVDEETQVVDHSMEDEGDRPGEDEEAGGDDENEPIEWPESPPREVLVS